jgi:hypothetical protein
MSGGVFNEVFKILFFTRHLILYDVGTDFSSSFLLLYPVYRFSSVSRKTLSPDEVR